MHDLQLNKKNNRIKHNIILANTKPPSSVSSATLKKVEISLKLSGSRSCVGGKATQLAGSFEVESTSPNDYHAEDIRMLGCTPSQTLLTVDYNLVQSSFVSQFLPPLANTGCRNSQNEIINNHEISSYQITNIKPNAPPPKFCRIFPPKFPYKRPLSSVERTLTFDFHTILKVVDVSIRTMICDRKFEKTPGVRLVKNSGGPKLADIAPTLFSPGYLEVRACHLKLFFSFLTMPVGYFIPRALLLHHRPFLICGGCSNQFYNASMDSFRPAAREPFVSESS